MRALVCCLLVAACAGHPPRAAAPALAAEARVPFWVSQDNQKKLSPYVVNQWRDLGLPVGEHTPVIVTFTGSAQPATEFFTAIGAAFVVPVTTEPGDAGTFHTRPTKQPTDKLLAMLPNEALRFAVVPAWVVRLDGANSWPFPPLDEEIEKKLDPGLRILLGKIGRHRPYAVGMFAQAKGCTDDAQREQLAALGAIVGSVLPHHTCSQTILTLELPLARVVAVASLPWIIHLEGEKQVLPETGKRSASHD